MHRLSFSLSLSSAFVVVVHLENKEYYRLMVYSLLIFFILLFVVEKKNIYIIIIRNYVKSNMNDLITRNDE